MSEPTGMRLGTGPLPLPTIGQLLTMSDEPIVKGPGPEWPDYDPALLEAEEERLKKHRLEEEWRQMGLPSGSTIGLNSEELRAKLEDERRRREEQLKREADEMRARFGEKVALLEELEAWGFSGFDLRGFYLADELFNGSQIEKILEVAKACDCEVQCEENEPYVEFTLTPRE